MIIRFIESIGDKTINSVVSIYDALTFFAFCLLQIANPYTYNSQMTKILIKQIYYTSVMVIPYFMMIAFFFGTIIIGGVITLSSKYGVQFQIGTIIVNFVMNEFAVLFTTLFIYLRSWTLINQELTLINRDNENDLIINFVLPHIISSIISNVTLSILLTIIMISSGFIFIFFFMGMDFHTYKHLIFNAMEIQNIVILLLKSIIFGFVTMFIPIYSELKVSRKRIFVKIFMAIFFIEILFLLTQKVIHAI